MKKKGKFITFEGTEGAGKSTQVQLLLAYLREARVPVVHTREPGGTPLAEALRQLILQPPDTQETIWPETELWLLAAARLQHVRQCIVPHIHAGTWVVCDRFVDATFAYQGGGRQMDVAYIQDTMERAIGDCMPDKTFYLHVPGECMQERLMARGQARDRLESEASAFFNRVEAAYAQRARLYPERIVTIDGTAAPEAVFQAIVSHIHFTEEL